MVRYWKRDEKDRVISNTLRQTQDPAASVDTCGPRLITARCSVITYAAFAYPRKKVQRKQRPECVKLDFNVRMTGSSTVLCVSTSVHMMIIKLFKLLDWLNFPNRFIIYINDMVKKVT